MTLSGKQMLQLFVNLQLALFISSKVRELTNISNIVVNRNFGGRGQFGFELKAQSNFVARTTEHHLTTVVFKPTQLDARKQLMAARPG